MATRRKLLEACVRLRLFYATQAWYPNSREINELEVCWCGCLRRVVKSGFSRKRDQNTGEQLFSYTYSNLDLESIIKTPPIRQFINVQYFHYMAHICLVRTHYLLKICTSQSPIKPISKTHGSILANFYWWTFGSILAKFYWWRFSIDRISYSLET